ncbi:Dor1-like family protein [Plectosphaerella cucumerina]|uniref:Conserved oligomeric Golgi complex subunit 8 n=1 Tax=Plectosphaerella cucumerina TaxID=40658 RepID=A0A8K0TPR3_9PEZI|nr:Dor1-like family protein [Plectosphaerella cucumerina]
MADALLDLLEAETPGLDTSSETPRAAKIDFLNHIAQQTPEHLRTKEAHSLSQSSHTLLLSLQGISKRSHKTIIDSATRHATLTAALPSLLAGTVDLQHAIPKLDAAALRFSTTYSKAGENEHLQRRKRALLELRNVERMVDVLELPSLLTSAVAAQPPNYAAALDLNAHIRRLHALYPDSPLVKMVSRQADEAVLQLTNDLIHTLKAPGLKLATALRTVGWLRRVMPDLDQTSKTGRDAQERTLALLFLRCRITTLEGTLGALQPLRELADEEKARQAAHADKSWSGGQQTERYLKKYIEIFREQSFGIVSMFKSIFPEASGGPTGAAGAEADPFQPMPSPLATFPLHLVELLLQTLREYLPHVRDQAARDSILTQVLYCSGSMGRLGGDFGMLLAGLGTGAAAPGDGVAEDTEWVDVVKRHRALAGRLDSIIGDYKGAAVKDR